MKVFWALMAVIAIAAVIMLTTDRGGTDQPASSAEQVQPGPRATEPTLATNPSVPTPEQKPAPSEAPQPPPEVKVPPAPPSSISTPQPVTPAAPTEKVPVTEPAPAPMVEPKAAPSEPASPPLPEAKPSEAAPIAPTPAPSDNENLLTKLKAEIEAERAAAAAQRASTEGSKTTEPTVEPSAGTAPPAAASTGLFGETAAEQKPDGSLLIEGKYLVSGKGTQADPYKVTWDHLISAERDYAPKDGKKTVPARIKALDGAWIEITGYVAFPLVSDETDELLSMMNQWDGCCIGIPPTPYDAIEVRLSTTVSGDTRLTTYGTITGKFKVDPHLVGGWLVGLYVIDQGKLAPKAFGGVAP